MHIIHFASTALTLDTFVRKISRSLENRGYTFDYVSDLGSVTEETSSNLPKFRLRRGLLFSLSWFGNGRAFQACLRPVQVSSTFTRPQPRWPCGPFS